MSTSSRAALGWRSTSLSLVVLVVLSTASTGRADLLNVQLDPSKPVVFGVNGVLTFNAANGNFHVDALALTYTNSALPNGFAFIDGGSSIIDLIVDNNGAFVANGTGVTVTGSIDLDGDGADDVTGDALNPLLTGTITNFGAQAAGPPTLTFDGLFTIDGGALTGLIPLSGGGSISGGFDVGTGGGFILSAENATTGILGDFISDFSSDQTKVQIGSVVPEPSGVTLAILAAATLGFAQRVSARVSHPRRGA